LVQRFKLHLHKLLSDFAFNFNLRSYDKKDAAMRMGAKNFVLATDPESVKAAAGESTYHFLSWTPPA